MSSSTSIVAIADLVILSGQSATRWVSHEETGDAVAIVIHSPNGLDAADFDIEGSHNGSTVFKLFTPDSAPTQVKAPTADRCSVYFELSALLYWRIKKAATTVAADRTFEVVKQCRP